MLAIYIRSLVLVCFAVLAMRLMGKRLSLIHISEPTRP